MKLATTTGDFNSYTQDQIESVKLIASAGFKYVDYSFDLDYNNKTGFYGGSPDKHCEDILRVTSDLGVKFIQAHTPCICILDEDEYKATESAIRASGLLGIQNVVVHSGYKRGMGREAFMAANRELYSRLCDLADGYGVTVLTENYDKMVFEDTFWPDCAEAVAELIDLVNHPRLGAVFDVGHANLKPMPIRDEIRLLGNRIKAIHVHDNNGRLDLHRAPFMGGSTSYDALLAGLADVGYEGYFTFEAVKMADLGASGHRLDEGEKLLRLPIDIRLELEKILYSMGKWMLSEYGVFEE